MNWLKRKGEAASNGYWDTISDIMTTLLLVLLLVIVLLILYVVQAPDYNSEKPLPETEIVSDGEDMQYLDREAGHKVVKTDVPYTLAGDEEEEYGRGEETGDYLYADGGFEEGEFDGHAGAAVRVVVADAETHEAVKEAGVTFFLYSSEGRRVRLYTYYPTKTAWIRYETGTSGAFVLPEKLPLATTYTLHEVTAPTGYQMADDVTFTLDEPKTWSEPYTLHVYVKSVRNTIHLTAVDSVTGDLVPDSVYDIVAAEDITTQDGTVRYAAGDVADQIIIDENGEGYSNALYLGNYTIQQSGAPDYYAVSKETYPVTLSDGENDGAAVEQQVLCEKTRFNFSVVDELYTNIGVSGAVFDFQSENQEQPVQLTSDKNGSIPIENLEKQTTYRLTQREAPEGYQKHEEEISFYVDEYGRIQDEPSVEEAVTNRTLRLSVLVQDALFKNSVSGCRVELYNEANQLVEAWDSSSVENVVQGMPAGQYRLEVSGAGTVTQTVQIDDTAELQPVTCSIWTAGNKLTVGGSAGGLGTAGLAAGLISKRKKRKQDLT